MSGVTTVNDRTLLVLLEYCTEVQQVFIEGCAKVTISHYIIPNPAVNFDVLHQEAITPEQSNRTMKIFSNWFIARKYPFLVAKFYAVL